MENPRQIISSLLKQFYELGWCSGSGGGISIREEQNKVYVAPSGVQKEMVDPEDIFVVDLKGNVLENATKKCTKISECTAIFNTIYQIRPNINSCIHSHSIHTVLVTQLYHLQFSIKDFEMIKGINGQSNKDWLIVPIIPNTEKEIELCERIKMALISYPKCQAILVQNHGVYVFGSSWQKAKIQAECYDYLFKLPYKLSKIGISLPKFPNQPDPDLRAWKMRPLDAKQSEDFRLLQTDLQHDTPEWVSLKSLAKLGILYWKLDGNKENTTVDQICAERKYQSRDTVVIDEESMEKDKYEGLLKKFQQEHFHTDEEIRYILGGSGFFDVRDLDDQWVRIHTGKGDLLILPEGIYHRFSPDQGNSVHAMRLFKENPQWVAVPRTNDETSASRQNYKNLLAQLHSQQ